MELLILLCHFFDGGGGGGVDTSGALSASMQKVWRQSAICNE